MATELNINDQTLQAFVELVQNATRQTEFIVDHRTTTCYDPLSKSEVKRVRAPYPPRENLMFIDDVCQFYDWHKDESPVIFVGNEKIIAFVNTVDREMGFAKMNLHKHKAFEYLSSNPKPETPAEFERTAKELLGVGDDFISRLRLLQWKKKSELTARNTNADSSMSIDEIAECRERDGQLFQDVKITLSIPVYVLPKTQSVSIDVHVIANAEIQKISVWVEEGVLINAFAKAQEEIRANVISTLQEVYSCPEQTAQSTVVCGTPLIPGIDFKS